MIMALSGFDGSNNHIIRTRLAFRDSRILWYVINKNSGERREI
jgi:hypothetical protein